jgi:hypothetical protein
LVKEPIANSGQQERTNMEMPNEINWPDSIWSDINAGVVKEAGKVRVAQKVFAVTTFDNNPPRVSNEVINFAGLSIQEGDTKPLVEIYANFWLTSIEAPSIRTGIFLACSA